MPFEVGKYHKGVLVGRMAAHGHFFEPFATVNGQCQSIFLVHNIYGAECPAVHFQRPPVLFGRVTVALCDRCLFPQYWHWEGLCQAEPLPTHGV